MTLTESPKRRARARPKTNPLLDKHEVNRGLLDVCLHYLGAPLRSSGTRSTWTCPSCAKPKFEAAHGVGGCWNGSCPVPTSTDAVGLIAFFEDLNLKEDFRRILERGYGILGLPEGAADRPPSRPSRHPGEKAAGRVVRQPTSRGVGEAHASAELTDAVYQRLLKMCPLEQRDRLYLSGRGIEEATIRRARFGSTTARRTRAVLEKLIELFGREDLLGVPGFFTNERGGLGFTLTGDYLLIPYHDREGRVTTVEGRYAGTGEPPIGKYLSLRDSGAHLYVFPGFSPERLEAFTEGSMGAILAAQEGLAVGAIKGIRCHHAPGGGPLPELAGADLTGRTVPYIPDSDDPPKEEVLTEAPRAARSLTLPHNGRPALATLPKKGMDLDEWLLSLPAEPGRRKSAFAELVASAAPL